MKNYRQRIIDNTIKEYLYTFGAIIIEGARATGKTTTAKNASKSVISLDESPQIAALAQTDPRTIFTGETPRLIDEWQLAPNTWNAVRHEADNRRYSEGRCRKLVGFETCPVSDSPNPAVGVGR